MRSAHLKIAACSLSVPVLLAASFAHAGIGTDVAWQMNYYYSRTLDDCGKGRPLDQCSGLRVRGTDSGKEFEPRGPSPASHKSGGVSFSFLREDSKYQDLGLLKTNGFVLKPNDFIDKDEMKIETLCFFPIDAWTDDRRDAGCGDNAKTGKKEAVCQDTYVNNDPNDPIDTAEEWLADYKSQGAGTSQWVNAHKSQCGFEIKDRPDAAEAFREGIRARKELQDAKSSTGHTINTQTELRTPDWRDDQDKELPILAFIYTPNASDAKAGLEKARGDQKRYFQKTGKWVPVIRVDMPTSNAAQAKFTYNESDQHRAAPTPKVENECTRYIKSAKWERREDPNIPDNPYSLMITPTECGRKMTKDQQAAAYAELYAKYGNDKEWNPDNGSMYQQFVCHLEWSGDVDGKSVKTRNKPTWNLEPVRPRASWDDVFKQACNPF